jgi:hypothetical protein
MPNLSQARKLQRLHEFIEEHDADPKGDAERLDALIKRPTQGSGSEVSPASSRDASDD